MIELANAQTIQRLFRSSIEESPELLTKLAEFSLQCGAEPEEAGLAKCLLNKWKREVYQLPHRTELLCQLSKQVDATQASAEIKRLHHEFIIDTAAEWLGTKPSTFIM